jgi:exonuclease VII large subunit
VRDAASLRAGDVITTRFEKGEVKSRVEAKTNNEEQNT